MKEIADISLLLGICRGPLDRAMDDRSVKHPVQTHTDAFLSKTD